MYMLAVLQYFNGMPLAKIKEIGFEIGLQGQQGIDHENMEQRYYLKSIPDKEFTGLQILSYMRTYREHIGSSLLCWCFRAVEKYGSEVWNFTPRL